MDNFAFRLAEEVQNASELKEDGIQALSPPLPESLALFVLSASGVGIGHF